MILTGLVLGTILGVVLQRGRFCVTGMIRDVFLRSTWRPFTALLIVIAVQAVGLSILVPLRVITPETSPLAPLAVVIGSVLFGIGIVAAGGCASGTWYRAGEGLVGSWLALIGYAASAAAMKIGVLSPVNEVLRRYEITQLRSLPETFGVSLWVFALPFAIAVGAVAWHFSSQGAVTSSSYLWHSPKPQTGTRRYRSLPLYTAAVLVGIIGIVAWPLSAATGRNDGLGITTPSKNVVGFLVTGDYQYLDWGALLVIGILLGATIAARVTGEYRVRVPDATTVKRSLGGGILMGVGASWAGGCTVGNGMVQTSQFTYQGWLALAATAVGVWIASKLWLKPSSSVVGTATSPRTASTPQASINEFTIPQASGFVTVSAHQSAPRDAVRVVEQPAHDGPQRFQLNSLGAVCPFPLIDARAALDKLESGDELEILFDCTQATETIPEWAADNGHQVVEAEQVSDAQWRIVIQKDAATAAVPAV